MGKTKDKRTGDCEAITKLSTEQARQALGCLMMREGISPYCFKSFKVLRFSGPCNIRPDKRG